MSQVDEYTIAGSPLMMTTLATRLENIFAAIASGNRGATAPENPFEGMCWWDTSAAPVEILKRYTVTAGWAILITINISTGAITVPPVANTWTNHRHRGTGADGDGALDYAADTGAANAYVVTLSPALTAHVTGMPVRFKAAHANTGASTININGLGAVAIKKYSNTALNAGDIALGQIVEIVYDGTYYQLISLPSFKKSFTQDDYYRLPGGLMIQWKYIDGGGVPWSSKAVTFPYAFPNACLGVFPLETNTSSAHAFASTSITASGCYVYAEGSAADYDVFVLIIGW